jgi:folate-binding protein YgfZ
MTETEQSNVSMPPAVVQRFPFGVLKMTGGESVDFLQRITTNDFGNFTKGNIQRTLLVTDKGRILDAVWVIHRDDHLLMLTSSGMSLEIKLWLQRFIIMEEIEVEDVTAEYNVGIRFGKSDDLNQTDYFGFPVSFEINIPAKPVSAESVVSSWETFELWRIENGIPITKKELVQDYNPLELNLWDWISFTKGCYIGQEVIARLDTYNKIQRILCKISSMAKIEVQEILTDDEGNSVGTITSAVKNEEHFSGLAVIRIKSAAAQNQFKTKESDAVVTIEKVFTKDHYGRT